MVKHCAYNACIDLTIFLLKTLLMCWLTSDQNVNIISHVKAKHTIANIAIARVFIKKIIKSKLKGELRTEGREGQNMFSHLTRSRGSVSGDHLRRACFQRWDSNCKSGLQRSRLIFQEWPPASKTCFVLGLQVEEFHNMMWQVLFSLGPILAGLFPQPILGTFCPGWHNYPTGGGGEVIIR